MLTLLTAEQYQEVRPFMITTYERGKIDGRLEGQLAGQRQMALLQLEAKFGPLPPAVQQRLEALSADHLRQLLLAVLKAQSLQELHLEE